MNTKKAKKQYIIMGGALEALRKNVSLLSKIPLFLALPITILLALGITLSPVLFGLMLAALPILIIGASIIGFVNFLINLKNTKKRCKHNLIPHLEQDLENKEFTLRQLRHQLKKLYYSKTLSEKEQQELKQTLIALKKKPELASKEPNAVQKLLKNLPPYIELFFKYFVIIPGSIGSFGGILFLVAMSSGINVFQMGAIVTFMSLTGIGGIAAFGLVIGISVLAMISLFIYKAKFEEKMASEHKAIHEKELALIEENSKLDKKLADYLALKNKYEKTRQLQPPSYANTKTVTDSTKAHQADHKPKFYDQKKSRSYIISGAILAGINEAIFMYSKYITFTGLCIVVLGGIGITFSPAAFIVLALALTVFTLIMAGIGVSKFLGAVNNVNKLAEDPVLHMLRTNAKQSLVTEATNHSLTSEQANILKYQKFINRLNNTSGITGFLIQKFNLTKFIVKIADNFPSIKRHFRAIETTFRYSYLFAVALGALTSGTILAAGIAGISITGLGAILSASLLSGFGIPVVAVAVIGLTALIATALIFYKKKYENPLAKAQRDAAQEKADLIEQQRTASKHSYLDTTKVRLPITLERNRHRTHISKKSDKTSNTTSENITGFAIKSIPEEHLPRQTLEVS